MALNFGLDASFGSMSEHVMKQEKLTIRKLR
jgi:hypothetical protein